jgi:diaminopimelate epimerase
MSRLRPHYYRAHGAGNDYLVFEVAPAGEPGWPLQPETVRALCARGTGVGSDGIVVVLSRVPTPEGGFPLRMFNPDGSEFERSGNGLRVLGSWLLREGLVREGPFRVTSGGVPIHMEAHPAPGPGIHDLSVDLGVGRAEAEVSLPHPELGEVRLIPVSVGNPHAVVFVDADPDGPLLRTIGPFLATHPFFAQGTNVQLARVEGGRLSIGIWERGVGRTSASGTSASAATLAAVVSGRLPVGSHTVTMPGGHFQVTVADTRQVVLRGPVEEVAEGTLTPGFLSRLGGAPPR